MRVKTAHLVEDCLKVRERDVRSDIDDTVFASACGYDDGHDV
jgi:hypothetical protein